MCVTSAIIRPSRAQSLPVLFLAMPALSVQGHSDLQQQVHLEEDPAEIHHTCGSSCLLTPYEPQSGPSALAGGQGLGGLCKMPCRSSGRESMMVSIWDCSLGRVPGLTGS